MINQHSSTIHTGSTFIHMYALLKFYTNFLQDACMQFINAVVSTPADDVDFKMHLRNEFMRCGLGAVLPVSPLIPEEHIESLTLSLEFV